MNCFLSDKNVRFVWTKKKKNHCKILVKKQHKIKENCLLSKTKNKKHERL